MVGRLIAGFKQDESLQAVQIHLLLLEEVDGRALGGDALVLTLIFPSFPAFLPRLPLVFLP